MIIVVDQTLHALRLAVEEQLHLCLVGIHLNHNFLTGAVVPMRVNIALSPGPPLPLALRFFDYLIVFYTVDRIIKIGRGHINMGFLAPDRFHHMVAGLLETRKIQHAAGCTLERLAPFHLA